MNSKLWIQKALTTCSLVALTLTYSMVALANSGKAVGELTISGGSADSTAFVTVNGEPAKSNRTVFASSTITTPEGMTAAVNFGKAGRIQFGPNTTFTLGADQDSISGDLASGSVTVLNAAKSVGVRTLAGETVQLNAGETATANSTTAAKQNKNDDMHWGWWALIFGGAVAGILYVALADNDSDFGGGSTTISPNR